MTNYNQNHQNHGDDWTWLVDALFATPTYSAGEAIFDLLLMLIRIFFE